MASWRGSLSDSLDRIGESEITRWRDLHAQSLDASVCLYGANLGFAWNHTEGEESTIIQFLDSALYLGDDVSIAALKFLAWRMQGQIQGALIHEDFGECPCYAVAMLLLCVSLNQCNSEIISFLISIAYCNHEYIPIFKEINDCQLSQEWRDTIYRILLDPTTLDGDRSGKSPAWRSNPAIQSLGLELMGDAAINYNIEQIRFKYFSISLI
jgi:hypothetical protein